MLMLAGILFVLAMLLFFIDKWADHADVDLSWPIKLLIFLSVTLIGINFYMQSK